MATVQDISVKLLQDAATFFRTIGEQNPELEEQMIGNADVYDQVAGLLAQDPFTELSAGGDGE
ncbi:MAG: hypothetical protein H6907_10815 [Hyphomicrobiales bacterium]|nr:hypothetical protein [Hyphomicrobiales bacterium]MCP5372210.1 hypothetical protein [Hyphomicrobiales bacterium]